MHSERQVRELPISFVTRSTVQPVDALAILLELVEDVHPQVEGLQRRVLLARELVLHDAAVAACAVRLQVLRQHLPFVAARLPAAHVIVVDLDLLQSLILALVQNAIVEDVPPFYVQWFGRGPHIEFEHLIHVTFCYHYDGFAIRVNAEHIVLELLAFDGAILIQLKLVGVGTRLVTLIPLVKEHAHILIEIVP